MVQCGKTRALSLQGRDCTLDCHCSIRRKTLVTSGIGIRICVVLLSPNILFLFWFGLVLLPENLPLEYFSMKERTQGAVCLVGNERSSGKSTTWKPGERRVIVLHPSSFLLRS